MTNEFQNNNLEPSNLSQIRDEKLEKDFQTVLDAFQKMPPDWKKRFLDNLAQNDPNFNKLFIELKKYFWNEILKLQKWKNKIPKVEEKENQKETNNISLLGESQLWHIEKDQDFSKYKHLFEEKEINWNKITILKWDVLKALLRQELNKEPLAKLIWFDKELLEAKKQYEEQLKASSNMPYSPQNMDTSKRYIEKQYEESKKSRIMEDITNNFVSLLKNTDFWKRLLNNSLAIDQNNKLISNINKNIWNKENAESALTENIANKTNILIGKLSKLQNELNANIGTGKDKTITEKYEKLIKQEIRNYAFDIWKDIIQNNSPIIWEWKVFSLPIWDKNDVVLDFSELWGNGWKTTEQILKLYEKNFNSTYKDTLISKIWREMTSTKWLIDISWTVLWWAAAVKVSAWTWGAWIPVATLVFTAVESSYRAWMYELFDIEWGWQAGVWIDLENESTQDILKKKSIELISTATLFSLFRFTGWSEEKIIKYINNPNITQSITWKISNYWIKTWIEWAFFTYFTVMMNNLQETAKNWWNTQEYLDSFTKVWNMEDLLKLYAFNLWFITAVKAGATIAEKWMILDFERQLKNLTAELNQKWYTIIDWRFYKWNNEVPALLNPNFKKFTDLNRKIAYIWGDSYIKPENGRGGKNYNTNLVDPAKRYERLEKNSIEIQTWKISYALNDKTIWETIQSNWLNSWKWVWEWLLKKSWFSNDEISQFKQWKLKWEKPVEVKAIWEMEKAMEVIVKEFDIIKYNLLNWAKKWLPINEILREYPVDIRNKIILLM